MISEANKALEATPERIAQVLSVFKTANCQDETGNKYRSVAVDEVIISALTRLSELEPALKFWDVYKADMCPETRNDFLRAFDAAANRIAKIAGTE